MTIDIRSSSLQKAEKRLKELYNMTYKSYYKIPDTNIYRFLDCEKLPVKEIDYKRAEKKFLVLN
jgi:hypothetical protein